MPSIFVYLLVPSIWFHVFSNQREVSVGHTRHVASSRCLMLLHGADPTFFSHSNPQNDVWGKGLWFPDGVWATHYFCVGYRSAKNTAATRLCMCVHTHEHLSQGSKGHREGSTGKGSSLFHIFSKLCTYVSERTQRQSNQRAEQRSRATKPCKCIIQQQHVFPDEIGILDFRR